MSKLGKRLTKFWQQRKIRRYNEKQAKKIRNYNADKVTKFIIQISENVKKITDQHKEDVKEFRGQISEIVKENTQQTKELIVQNSKQNADIITQNKRQNSNLTKQFLVKSDKQITDFTKRFSRQIKLEQDKFLEQILEKNNAQFSEFIERLMEKNNEQNSILIKQNTQLVEQILSQSLENHGTIRKKFEELLTYQVLSTFRENLITIKTSISILEKLDNTKFKITYKLYLKYQKIHPGIPVLDITRGMIIIKILFPPFFTQMLNGLLILKGQFEYKTYIEMRDTIKQCDYFFKNFKKLDGLKKMLDSGILIADTRLAELIIPIK